MPTMLLMCAICDTTFEAEVETKRRKFCSAECRAARIAAQIRRYRRERRYPKYPRPLVDKICMVCEAPFRTERIDQRTCGRRCGATLAARVTGPRLAEAARVRNERPCAWCGLPFVPSNPSAKQRREGYLQRCCGQSCAKALRSARKIETPLPLFEAVAIVPRKGS